MLATCICLNGSLLDQLCCTIFNLFAVYLYTFGQINMSVCLSVIRYLCVEHSGSVVESRIHNRENWVRIPIATILKVGHFRSLNDTPVHSPA